MANGDDDKDDEDECFLETELYVSFSREKNLKSMQSLRIHKHIKEARGVSRSFQKPKRFINIEVLAMLSEKFVKP